MGDASRTTLWRRVRRAPWYLGLLWVAGCFDVCAGAGNIAVVDREVQQHAYADAAVWNHARAFLQERESCALPEVPALGEWHECARMVGTMRITTRVKMQPASGGYTITIQSQTQLEGSRPGVWNTQGPMMIELMQRADPTHAAEFARRRREADEQLSRGCQPFARAGCAAASSCWRWGGGQGC
ncbi:MAG: hypothetical protein JNK05_39575 [Myxococcales bacterium]|nr:hypothetical protein [Myxococcales bacterium]